MTTPEIAGPVSMLDAAVRYARSGLYVFPVFEPYGGACACPNGARCEHPAKHPRTAHGLNDATIDEAQTRAWFGCRPNANIGIAMEPSGLLVLDVDPRHDGNESLHRLERQHGELGTLCAVTGGGGMHYYFSAPSGVQIASRANALGDEYPGIDVRAKGGYTIAPPSVHISGQRYAWEVSSPSRPGPVSQWLLDMLIARDRKPIVAVNTDDEIILEGERNAMLTRYAGRLRRLGTGAAAIQDALLALNERQCSPPLAKDEVRQIARSVGRYVPSERLHDGADRPAAWGLESAATITARGVQPVEYDVEGLLTREDGPGIMFGPPAALKSFIAAHLAGCIATGEPFLGHYTVQRRPFVIFVNLDAGASAFARRIARLGFRMENLLITSPENYDAAALRQICERYPGAFVVLDTLSDMYRSKTGEDPAQAMRRFVRELRSLFAQFLCNGLILDHPRRPRDGETNADYYGSTQKEAAARVMWHVTRLPATEQGIARAKIACRKVSEAEPFTPFVAKIDFRGELIVATWDGELDQSVAAVAGPSDVEVIEQVLRGVPDGMTSRALEARSGRSRDRVLDAVRESKKILALGKGRARRYRLLESPAPPYDFTDDLEGSREKSPGSSATLGYPGDTGDSGGRLPGSESSAPPGDSPGDFTEVEI